MSIFLFSSLLNYAQPKAYFTLLNQDNGLRSGDVMCFEQDYNGFIWIGTKFGLNVYDGNNFNTYELSTTTNPFNSDVSCLTQDSAKMWIGTLGDGMFYYNIENKQITEIKLKNLDKNVNNILCFILWNDKLYVGTDQGLCTINKLEECEFVNLNLTRSIITSLEVFNGFLMVGTANNGLLQLSKQNNVVQKIINTDQINALQSVNDNSLLVGTESDGLIRIEKTDSVFTAYNISKSFCNKTPIINTILLGRNNDVWIGTDGEGLFQLSFSNNKVITKQKFRHSDKNRNTIASNAVFSLFEDNDGKIWIGTIWKGLNILNQEQTGSDFFFSDYFGVNQYPVLSIHKTDDELLIGTDGKGLNIIDLKKEKVKQFNTESLQNITGDYVQTIFTDSKGKTWLGTFSSGLILFDKAKGTIRTFVNEKANTQSIAYNDVRTILEDENNNLWIATWGGGLNKYLRNEDIFQRFTYADGDNASHLVDNITSMCFTSDKKGIWIGSFGNGLFYFDLTRNRYQRIELPEFQTLKVLSLHLSNDNKLWLGTWGNGVKVLDVSLLETVEYTGLELISSARITSILEDEFNNLWFSSKNGILKFNSTENTLFKYGGFNLISNKEFHINSSFKDKDGKIYFGGIEGVISITPTATIKTKKLNKPVITHLDLYNEKSPIFPLNQTTEKNTIKLNYDQNYFTFSFATPHFETSDVNYSFKMAGLKDEWLISNSNKSTFTNLAPGEYTFKVRASLNNYKWSEPTLVHIFIAQPIWKRWYAYTAYVLVFVFLLFLFQKYAREKEALKSDLKIETLTREKENELHNIKNRFFTNISHEIRTPVTLILGAVNRLTEVGALTKSSQKEVDVMQNSGRHLLNLIHELLDFRRLEMDGIKLKVAEGNFERFAHEIYLSFQTQASTNNIDYLFMSRSKEILLWFDRDQMEKVIYNLVSNAFKYTPSGGTITVELDNDDQHAFLKVVDSGKGMDESQISEIFKRFYQSENASEIRKSGFGLGLSIAKEIIELHGGEIAAANNESHGINISVKIPLGNKHFSIEQQLKSFKNSDDVDHYITDSEDSIGKVSLSKYSDSSLLIVEDNKQLLDYVKGLFADIDTIYTAKNGQEGLDIAYERIPDLIISDVMMPIMDGVNMTRKLKTHIRTSHIPIILLTARTNLIYKREGFEVGADDYVTKPFNETLLKTRVYNLLKSRKQLSEKLLNEYISKPQEELSISTPDQQFLSDLTNVIENNIHENDINAKLITEALCMSHSVVYKKLKALTGLSLVEFIRDFKLKRAAILLAKYQMSVSDVCYKVGFSDRRYFSKLFKSKFDLTPSEYAKKGVSN